MLSYYLKRRKNAESKKIRTLQRLKTEEGSKFSLFNSKQSIFLNRNETGDTETDPSGILWCNALVTHPSFIKFDDFH